jgi:hypothetical protein
MKTKRILGLAAIACSIAVTFSSYGDSPFSERDARNNTAVAASPRARESFPWLTRTAPARERSVTRPADLNNRAYANSPRVREVYPELTRSSSETRAAACVHIPELANRAFAASPRVKEAYPWLLIRTDSNAAECASCMASCTCCRVGG